MKEQKIKKNFILDHKTGVGLHPLTGMNLTPHGTDKKQPCSAWFDKKEF